MSDGDEVPEAVPAPVVVRHVASGATRSMTPEQARRAIASGRYAEETDLEMRQRAQPIQTEYVEPVVAGASAALGDVSFGTSHVLEHGLEETIDRPGDFARVREQSPTATALGHVGGIAASVVEGGGAGLLAPAEAAGARVAAAVAPVGAGAARRALGSALGMGTEAALQGAAIEGGEILSETAVGDDPGDVAERMIAATSLAGVLGGGLGAGGAMLRHGATRGRTAVRDTADMIRRSFQQRTGRALTTEASEALAEHVVGASALLSGHSAEAIRTLASPTSERIVTRGEQVLQDGTRALSSDMDRTERAWERVRELGIVGVKNAGDVERFVGGDLRSQMTHADEQIRATRALVGDMDSTLRAYGGTGFGPGGVATMNHLRGEVARAADHIAGIRSHAGMSETRRQAEAFVAMDALRRALGEAADRVGLGEEGVVYDRFMSARAGLEDAALWGPEAATLQREVNAAYHPLIAASSPFRQAFMRDSGLPGAFRVVPEADTARVHSFLSRSGDAANGSAESVFSRRYEAMRALSDAVLSRGSTSGGEREAATELRDSLRALQETHAGAAGEAQTLREWREMQGGGSPILGGAIGGAAAVGSAAIAGPLLGAAMLANPARGIRIIQTIRRMTREMDGRITSSVRGFLGRGARTAAEYGRISAQRGRRAATRGAAAYAARIADLDAHSDPRALVRTMADSTAELSRHAPRTQAALYQTTARALAYLQAHRPRGRSLPGSLRADDRGPSREEQDRFLRISRAVDDPASVLDDLRSRRLTPEAVAALRDVYPAFYRRLVFSVARELADGDSQPSYQDRLQLGVLLGIPTDPSLTPQAMAILQAPQQEQAPPRRGGGRMPDLARGLSSTSDRTERRASHTE